MKRTFHVWNRELKIVTQIILNTSFWENFTENGRSQIFTSKKRWRFITVHYAQTSFVQVVYFLFIVRLWNIHTRLVLIFSSRKKTVFEDCTKEDCLLFILVSHWCFFVFVHAVNSNWNCQGSPFGQPSDWRENVFLLF